MDRLLYKEADGDITCRSRDFDKVFPTLYAYEETGLTPDEIVDMKCILDGMRGNEYIRIDDRLRELLKAEQEGRLMVQPCKVGDTIYVLQDTTGFENIGKIIWECKVIGFTCRKSVAYVMFLHTTFHIAYLPHEVSCDDLGRRWFLTLKEAEAALAKDNNVPTKKEENK